MANRWFILGGLLAFAIFLPNLIWQIQHHFPHLKMLANIRRSGRNITSDRSDRVHRVATAGHATSGGSDLAVRLVCVSVQRRRQAVSRARLCVPGVAAPSADQRGKILLPGAARVRCCWPERMLSKSATERPGRGWMRPAYLGLVAVTGAMIALNTLRLCLLASISSTRDSWGSRNQSSRIASRVTCPQFLADEVRMARDGRGNRKGLQRLCRLSRGHERR